MHLVQLLLPVKFGSPETTIAQTRQELVDAFEGVTAYVRSPAKGAWVAPGGQQEHDDVIMVEVLVDALDRQWWRQYAEQLATRFSEEKIHVRFIPAEIP